MVVVRGHREAVRADTGYDEHVARARGRKPHRTDEDVPALAEPARHGDLIGCPGVRAPCDRRGVLRPVERRPDVVAHSTIDRHERAEAFDPLGTDNAIEGDRGAADDPPARLDEDRRTTKSAALLSHRFREGAGVVGETDDFIV